MPDVDAINAKLRIRNLLVELEALIEDGEAPCSRSAEIMSLLIAANHAS